MKKLIDLIIWAACAAIVVCSVLCLISRASAAAPEEEPAPAPVSVTEVPAPSNGVVRLNALNSAVAMDETDRSGKRFSARYGGFVPSLEREALARIVWLEARGEPFAAKVGVAEVVLNRVSSAKYPDDIIGVITDEKYGRQFTPAPYLWSEDTLPTSSEYEAADAALHGEPTMPETVIFFSTKPYNSSIYAHIGKTYFCEED